MKTALITIGIIIGTFSIGMLIAYLFVFPFLNWYFTPEVGSNDHLREWLNANPTKDIGDYQAAHNL